MKATGIIRRIDDLGRVIVPKEIRRTLRIREGDPLEIFVEDGGVIFKKYSAVQELSNFSQTYTDSLYKTIGHISIITDKDKVIAISGISKRDYLNKNISETLEKIIDEKDIYTSNTKQISVIDEQLNSFVKIVIAPIISEGETIGSVILASENTNKDFNDIEFNLVKNAAIFLGKQMED